MIINRKMLALYSALVVLGMLPGCDKLSDALGISRTMPDGTSYAGGARHAPLLNPELGNPYNVNNAILPQEPARVAPTLNPETGQYETPVRGNRQVPAENPGNQPVSGDMTPPPQSAPSGPTSQDSGSGYPSLAAVPPVPVHTGKEQSADEMKALGTQRDTSESARSSLMNDQNATVMTSPQTGQMVDNAATAAPQPPVQPAPSAAAIVTPPPVAPAPMPAPQAANTQNDTGFNAWLHRTFSHDNAAATNAAPVRHTPAENPGSESSVATAAPVTAVAPPHELMASEPPPPAPAPQAMPEQPQPPFPPAPVAANPEPAPAMAPAPEVAYAPPPAATPAPEVAYAPPAPPAASPAVEQVPQYPAIAAQPEMEPVHLHPPAAAATEEQYSAANAPAPVALVPPSSDNGGGSSSGQHYLADSRYAARRMSQGGYDDSGNQ